MISVKKLKEWIEAQPDFYSVSSNDLLSYITNKANQVEGVRGYCKDCKKIVLSKFTNEPSPFSCPNILKPNGYCSEFEPKELGTDDLSTSQEGE